MKKKNDVVKKLTKSIVDSWKEYFFKKPKKGRKKK